MSGANYRLKAPIAFLIFNRPDTTARVFAEIAKARPNKLLVVADGPRADHPADHEKCQQTRAIIDQVDWECEVHKNYSHVNLGCKRRVSSGLDWVFDAVERAIILEDDVVPHPTFFRYCDELLERYADDDRIGAVSGCNFQFRPLQAPHSYYFSIYNHCWGWASWARAWRNYDVEMKLWPEARDAGYLEGIFSDECTLYYWTSIFQRVYENKIDTWDYQWAFCCWVNNMMAILPRVNLTSNIGFREDATHTTEIRSMANLATQDMTFPLVHPPFRIRNLSCDSFYEAQMRISSKSFGHSCPHCNPKGSFRFGRLLYKLWLAMTMVKQGQWSALATKMRVYFIKS